MAGGFNAGFYYRYVPIKWIGVQSGISYQFLNENQEYLINRGALKDALVIPLQAVVFPKFRFNLTGGVYMKTLFGKTVTSDEVHNSVQSPHAKMYPLSKHAVFGYAAGIAWNRKFCRIALSFRQDINSWMDKDEQRHVLHEAGEDIFLEHTPKSMTFNLSVEVPLWRFRK